MENKKPGDATQPIAQFGTSPNLSLPGTQSAYVGLTFKDRYRIERLIGQGGIGAVYLASDTQLHGRPVVVKVLLAESEASMHNPWFRQKFEQEVEALVRIDHPGVVGVLDAGATPDGKPFFAMQFVEGANLRAIINEGPLPFVLAADIVRQLGAALSAIHDKGIIHRDLKPENIMLQRLDDANSLVKIIDFGIATVKDSRVASSGEKTKVVGALPYMAPEQLRGAPETGSDTWALGVIAYELLTGKLPFYADTILHLYELQRSGVGVHPRTLRPELPERAESEILRALSFDAADRHARARDFADALARALTVEQKPTEAVATSSTTARMRAAISSEPEIAHVLFMDLVGYSLLPSDTQAGRLRELRDIVLNTPAFVRAREEDRLLSLPTGDGMALVFFGDPAAPAQCAIEIARALKDHPELPLRQGIHSGPVYRVSDINTNLNVTGGGINHAQRVMDCGDAGHILVSHAVAEILREIGMWSDKLIDLGEHDVKHGLRIHLYSLYTEEAGNPMLPMKVQQVASGPLPQSPAPSRLSTNPLPKLEQKQFPVRRTVLIGIAAVLVLVAGSIPFWWQSASQQPGPDTITPLLNPAVTLSYSITARRNPDRFPAESAKELPGEIIFEPGDELRVNITGGRSGFFYIINEGPEPKDELPAYNMLFPDPAIPSPAITAGQTLYIPGERPPWFHVDDKPGTEKLWLVWSEQAVEELERVRKWLGPETGGRIGDAAEIRMVRDFLNVRYQNAKPVAEKDESQVHLRGGADGLLIYLLKLEHR